MGGCPSADTVRPPPDADARSTNGARAVGGQPRAVATGDQRPHTPIIAGQQHQAEAAHSRQVSTPNPSALAVRPLGLSVAPPETPDGRPRGSAHPDIIRLPSDGDAAAVATVKYLERERARISMPDTPTSTQASIYKHSCPLCLEYFREGVWKVSCCANTVCIICALAHVRTRSSNPAVSTWHSLPENEPLAGVACPVCNSIDVRFTRVASTDKARSYQESPHTRDLFAQMEARKRFELGVQVSGMHMNPGHHASSRAAGGTHREAMRFDSRSDTASMRAVRNHPVADLRRATSDPDADGADAIAGPGGLQHHHSVLDDRTPDEHEFEIEHEEDEPISATANREQPTSATAAAATAAVAGSAAASPLFSSSSSSSSSSAAAAAASSIVRPISSHASHSQGLVGPSAALPPRPVTSSAQSAGRVALGGAVPVEAMRGGGGSRPDSAPSTRAEASAAGSAAVTSAVDAAATSSRDGESTVPSSTRRVSTPLVDVQGHVLPLVPTSVAAASSSSTSGSSLPSERRSSSGRAHAAAAADRLGSADNRRLSQGWTPVVAAEESHSSRPASVRVLAISDESKESPAEVLFLPSPHAKLRGSPANHAAGPGQAYRTPSTFSFADPSALDPSVSPTAGAVGASSAAASALATPHDAATVVLEEVRPMDLPRVSSLSSVAPPTCSPSLTADDRLPPTQLAAAADLLEQSFSFDGSIDALLASHEMQSAAVHPMPSEAIAPALAP